MITNFPHFKPLEISDEKYIQNAIGGMPPYSDFNFVSLWSWNVAEQIRVSTLYDNLVVRFTDYTTGDPFYSFFGQKNTQDTINALLAFSKKEIKLGELRLIPAHSFISPQETSTYSLHEDRGEFDYVYDLSKTFMYRGRALKQKRHLVNNFLNKHTDARVAMLNLKDPQVQKDVLEISKLSVNKENPEAALNSKEYRAINRFIELANPGNQPNIIPLGIYISDQMIVFNITEIVQGSWAIVHFEKGDFTAYPEAGAYVFYELLKILSAKGVKYINLEQDLDIEGLRKNKMSYRPAYFLKKYRIRAADA